jgi:PAS domain S-box-containing protein
MSNRHSHSRLRKENTVANQGATGRHGTDAGDRTTDEQDPGGSEDAFREVIAVTGIGIFDHDHRTDRIYWSPEQRRNYGWDAAEPVTLPKFIECIHPDDRDRVSAAVRRAHDSAGDGRFDIEHRIIRRDGAVRWLSTRSRTTFEGEGAAARPRRTVGAVFDITDRMAADIALRTTQAQLLQAQQLAHIGSWELDLTSGRLDWSDEIFRIFEIDKKRFGASYEAFLAALHPMDRAAVDKAYTDSIANRTPYQITHRLRMPDGRVKWVEERCETEYGPDGKALRSRGTVQDITGPRQVELAMRALSTELTTLDGPDYFEAAVRQLASLLDADIAFITRLDPVEPGILHTVALFEDGRVVPNIRYPTAGTPCAEIAEGSPTIIPHELQRRYPAYALLKDKGIVAYAGEPLVSQSGQRLGHIGVMSRKPLRDPATVATILNIFAVAVAARSMRERSRQQYRDLFEFAPEALVLSDRQGRIVLANRQAEAIFGWTREELIGRSVETLVPDGMRAGHAQLRRRFVKTPQLRRMAANRPTLVAQRKDGRIFPAEIDLAPVETEEGVMIAAAVRDVTARRDLERQLEQAIKMEAIGKLTGGMAHDFNNYLGVIIGNLDLLKETEQPGSERAALIDAALSGAQRGAELTESLLAFSRRQPLDPRVTDLNQRIERIAVLLSRTLGEDIEFGTALDAALWPAKIDGAQLDSCIVNLANNARDAMPCGGALTIATRNTHLDDDYARINLGAAAGDYVLIEVSDTGEGMTPDVAARVFEPFFTTKGPGHGTGLGLSMVYGFVRQSGGYIKIYSEVGHGTTVRIYLPRADAEGIQDVRPAPSLTPQHGGTLTILVVEDNTDMRSTTVAQLFSLGYQVIEAANGDAALDILERQAPRVDLVFSDVVMPGKLDGYALATAVLERWPGTKVLLASGFPGDTLRRNGKDAGRLRLLGKPYRKDELARAILATLKDGTEMPPAAG